MKKKFYYICTQASSKTEEDRKRYYLLPLLLPFPISQKQLKRPIGKGRKGKIQLPSVDKRECSLFGIHQATSPLPEGKKKGKIHPPLVDNQEWNSPTFPWSSTFPFFLPNP